MTEFVNLERSQQLHHLSSALAAATTPRDVANAAVTAGLEALGADAAVVRVPVPGTRTLSCLAGSGEAALLTRTRVPLEWTAAGSCFVEGRTTVTTVTPTDEAAGAVDEELVPGVRGGAGGAGDGGQRTTGGQHGPARGAVPRLRRPGGAG